MAFFDPGDVPRRFAETKLRSVVVKIKSNGLLLALGCISNSHHHSIPTMKFESHEWLIWEVSKQMLFSNDARLSLVSETREPEVE